MKKIVLLGYFIETYELCKKIGYDILGYVDHHKIVDANCMYLGNDDEFMNKYSGDKDIYMVMVPDKPSVKKSIYERYHEAGFSFETVISPMATVSELAEIGEGCVIHDLCNVSPYVKLGKCTRMNVMANIMHESGVGNYSTLAPNSVVLGRCNIGQQCYIGANATILPECCIEDSVMVGAGAVVTKSIVKGLTVIGVPAREIDKVTTSNI